MILKKISRLYNTVCHMTSRQWRYRIYYMLRNRLKKRTVRQSPNGGIQCVPLTLNYDYDLKKMNSVDIANEILINRFNTVSGIVKDLGTQIDWDLKDEDYRLVCFKINSFKWLMDLSDGYKWTQNEAYLQKGFELIDDWNEKNRQEIKGDKWNPYVIAERIVNWICFCSMYCKLLDKDIGIYARYIYEQAAELMSSIEYHLEANHLLSEAKALVCAGVFLKEDSFYRTGKQILYDELEVQFLADGGHYERSVSYHVESLQQYFEAIAVMQIAKDNAVYDLGEKIIPLYMFLDGMINANGRIPLVNDSAYDYPFYDAPDFLSTAGILFGNFPINAKCGEYYRRWKFVNMLRNVDSWEREQCFKDTGYFNKNILINNKRFSVLFDVGNGGPDSNMGHSHADALSVLLSSDEKNILVDSGVFTYKPGMERDACRATSAHNTVEIDGKDSAEIWSAFRVAKRGHTYLCRHEENDEDFEIEAYHDGYRKIIGNDVIHSRTVKYCEAKKSIMIYDKIDGKGEHRAVSRFHISPDCSVRKRTENSCLIDNEILLDSSVPIEIVKCDVAEMFGIKKETHCVEILFEYPKVKETIVELYFIKEGEQKNG